jgi:hypothetical protein
MTDQLGCDICKRSIFGSCFNGPLTYLSLSEEKSRGPCEPVRITYEEIKICADCYTKVEKKILGFFQRMIK